MPRPSFLGPILRSPSDRFILRNERSGRTLATAIETAFDSASRRKGLLGRDRLDEGAVLIIAPSNAVHTFFMRFPIDVVFVGRDGAVRKTYSALRAWRIAFALGAFAAIELPPGVVSASGTRRGDALRLVTS